VALITGQYPDYRAIFPSKKSLSFARVSNNQLWLHANNAKAYAKDAADSVRIDFPKRGEPDSKLILTAHSKDKGDSVAEIFATSDAYQRATTSLNIAYLLAALEKRTKKQLAWDKIGQHDPILTIGCQPDVYGPITIQNLAEYPDENTLIMPLSVGV
ncbi:hypothetical protein LCGC14_2536260, partial [marine sediment metagenome]